MARKQTTETFTARVAELTDNEYIVVGEYVNNKTKIAITHTTCNTTYLVKPKGFLDGNRCPHCRNKLRGAKPKTQEQFAEEVANLTDNEYIVVGEYTGATNKVAIQHRICGNSWKVSPNSFLSRGTRCPTCVRDMTAQEQRYSTEQFIQRLEERFPKEYTVLSEYMGSKKKVLVRHNRCGNEWEIKASHLLHQNMCPRCKSSKGEALIRKYLTNIGLDFTEQQTFPSLELKKSLSYDFYIPSQQLLIEYQGIQHYEPIAHFGGTKRFELQQESDKRKRKYASEHGLRLVEVPYSLDTLEKVSTYLEQEVKLVV